MFEGDDILAEAQHWEHVIAHAQAQQLKCFMALALRKTPDGHIDEHTADEFALALNISCASANRRLSLAWELTERLPETLAALERGELDLPRARVIAGGTRGLSPELTAQVQARVLPKAVQQHASQLRQAVRRAVLRVDPDGEKARHHEQRHQRRVVLTRS